MKKIILIVLSLIIFKSSVFASSDWIYFAKDNDGKKMYVDVSSIYTKNGNTSTWIKVINADNSYNIKNVLFKCSCREYTTRSYLEYDIKGNVTNDNTLYKNKIENNRHIAK